MPILVTVSVDLAESVTLRDLQQFVQAAERNGADPDVDLREYDENNNLVGLAAVSGMGPGGGEDGDGEGDEGEEGDGDEEGDEDESPQQS